MIETKSDAPLPQIAEPQTQPMPTQPTCCASVPEVAAAGDTVTIRGCGIAVGPDRLMCDTHWALVSGEVRRELVKVQQRMSGQYGRSTRWRELAKEAVLEVWKAQVRKLETDMQAVIAARRAGSVTADAPPPEAAPAAEGPPHPADG